MDERSHICLVAEDLRHFYFSARRHGCRRVNSAPRLFKLLKANLCDYSNYAST